MSLERFLSAPWKNTHTAYEESVFNIRPAPEFATAEVLVASTYRSSGFKGHTESSVPGAGRQLDKASSKARKREVHGGITADTWRLILHGALESPKQPKQSSRRFLQLCPIVPDVALYSGSARLSGNSWDPGQLVQRMIQLGSSSRADAEALWAELHAALSVQADDDVWARWLQLEFEKRGTATTSRWRPTELADGPTLPDEEKVGLRAPAIQFVQDLAATIRAKSHMTRRQWVSLLEAVVRLGAVAHVLWLCDLNDRLWRASKSVVDGGEPASVEGLTTLIASGHEHYLVYGRPALPIIRELASRYLVSRLGLNLLLWRLAELGVSVAPIRSIKDVAAFLQLVERHRTAIAPGFQMSLGSLEDGEARTLACKKGIGSNLVEFCRHALGQRQTADQILRGYDQGYQLKKRAEYASAPWIVSLGPVALLALVHCCLDEVSGPRSVQRLCEHLAWYGLDVDMDNIARSDLGRELRMLGLVLDSPDAESGMLLIPPFDLPSNEQGRS